MQDPWPVSSAGAADARSAAAEDTLTDWWSRLTHELAEKGKELRVAQREAQLERVRAELREEQLKRVQADLTSSQRARAEAEREVTGLKQRPPSLRDSTQAAVARLMQDAHVSQNDKDTLRQKHHDHKAEQEQRAAAANTNASTEVSLAVAILHCTCFVGGTSCPCH